MKMLEEYFLSNPKFEDQLNSIEPVLSKKIWAKLSKETNKTNFTSTISEFRFAHFFNHEKLNPVYEPKIGTQTPDFQVTINKTNCFCDVKKFNLSESDQQNRSLLNNLLSRLKSIEPNTYVSLNQLDLGLDFNIESAVSEISDWLKNAKLGDIYILDSQIKIEIIKSRTNSDHILSTSNPSNPIINESKIKSIIIEKLNRYESIAKTNPFFICIDQTFTTLREPHDYLIKFLGGSCENIDTGAECFQLGDYYNDSKLNLLAGILLLYNTEYYWLPNPRCIFKIDFPNTIALNKYEE